MISKKNNEWLTWFTTHKVHTTKRLGNLPLFHFLDTPAKSLILDLVGLNLQKLDKDNISFEEMAAVMHIVETSKSLDETIMDHLKEHKGRTHWHYLMYHSFVSLYTVLKQSFVGAALQLNLKEHAFLTVDDASNYLINHTAILIELLISDSEDPEQPAKIFTTKRALNISSASALLNARSRGELNFHLLGTPKQTLTLLYMEI